MVQPLLVLVKSFADLGAQLTVIGENPDGLNINDGVGSTHPEHLQGESERSRRSDWSCL